MDVAVKQEPVSPPAQSLGDKVAWADQLSRLDDKMLPGAPVAGSSTHLGGSAPDPASCLPKSSQKPTFNFCNPTNRALDIGSPEAPDCYR